MIDYTSFYGHYRFNHYYKGTFEYVAMATSKWRLYTFRFPLITLLCNFHPFIMVHLVMPSNLSLARDFHLHILANSFPFFYVLICYPSKFHQSSAWIICSISKAQVMMYEFSVKDMYLIKSLVIGFVWLIFQLFPKPIGLHYIRRRRIITFSFLIDVIQNLKSNEYWNCSFSWRYSV